MTNADEDVKKLDHTHSAVGNIKYSHSKKIWKFITKVKNALTLWTRKFLLAIYPT